MASSDRRIDLDWVRILAFGVLILFHVGMYYVTWGWHVKSPYASHALEPLGSGDAQLRLASGRCIRLSRRYRDEWLAALKP